MTLEGIKRELLRVDPGMKFEEHPRIIYAYRITPSKSIYLGPLVECFERFRTVGILSVCVLHSDGEEYIIKSLIEWYPIKLTRWQKFVRWIA